MISTSGILEDSQVLKKKNANANMFLYTQLAEIKTVLVELLSRWRFLGIEREDGELLVGGEECIGRGVRFANPSLTQRPAGGLRVRFKRL